MARPAVALVVGFTRRPGLLERSFAPLQALRRAGVLDRILYVTWDRPDLDPWLAAVARMPEVELVRVPEPEVRGEPYQRKHFYQTHNIAAGLALLPDDETLIVKLRPDQVIDPGFLAAKIADFDRLCAPSQIPVRFGAPLPSSPFHMKIWTPWADSNQPFFLEDGLFAARRGDAVKLVTWEGDAIVRRHGDARSGWIVHVARYIAPFLNEYSIFARYLEAFHCFVQDDDQRRALMIEAIAHPFFWHLAIANAWILANNFHIDCGRQGDILFYPPESLAACDDPWRGAPLDAIPARTPFNDVELWRRGQQPGSFLPCMYRPYGRLVDDDWQEALFTRPQADISDENLRGVLHRIALHGTGILDELEDDFYRMVERVSRRHPAQAA